MKIRQALGLVVEPFYRTKNKFKQTLVRALLPYGFIQYFIQENSDAAFYHIIGDG